MGLIEKLTGYFLASKVSNPTQASLTAVLNRVTRVRVIPFANYTKGTVGQKTLADTLEPDSLASFRNCFAIVDDPATFGHCMCCGEPHIELFSGDQLLATIGYHHGSSIRWNAWNCDAWLKEPEKLLDWMSTHGVTGPRQEVEREKKQAEEAHRSAERWVESMPACLLPFWANTEEMTFSSRDPAFQKRLLDVLRSAIPDSNVQAMALFGWFGSGEGPWSGYPSYESVPECLLLHYSTNELVDVLTHSSPIDSQWRGAARYFGGWEFSQNKKKDRSLLPASMKHRLMEVAMMSGIEDNFRRAENAFRS